MIILRIQWQFIPTRKKPLFYHPVFAIYGKLKECSAGRI